MEEFIKEKFKVSFHKIPFYIKWINLYNNFTIRTGAIKQNPDTFHCISAILVSGMAGFTP